MLAAPEPVAVAEISPSHTVTALQLQIHNDLRTQHPEWIQSDGACPICDFYEERLAQLLEGYAQTESVESAAAIHLALQEAANVNQLPVA